MLNGDVLRIILSFLRGENIVNAMCTCHSLYDMGLPILLGSPIRVEEDQIEQFATFILKDAARYGPMLREITLVDIARCSYFMDFEVANAKFCDILDHAINIRAFRIRYSELFPLCNMRSLVEKLFTLPTLQRLSFSFRHSPRHRFVESSLANAVCPLTHLEFGDSPHYVSLPSSWFRALSRFSSTLKTLSIPLLPIDAIPGFPHITTIKTSIMAFPRYIPTSTIFRLFPNLKNIAGNGILLSPLLVGLMDYDNWRSRNTQDAERQPRWPELCYVKMRIDELCALGLGCPVRALHLVDRICNTRPHYFRSELPFGTLERELILGCRPQALKVSCELQADVCDLFQDILSNSPQLMHVEYDLSVVPTAPGTPSWIALLVNCLFFNGRSSS
ncbi:hypothetical protein K474DRAFT_1334599 [Panus rudis PR-1116 ss-1]|nr:hypothetical protein K474DRAFT_1334599 [Panus rudis PR-1116 ss-1]